MRFKRIISAITGMAVLASSMSVLSGCSMKEFFSKDESSSGAADDGVISNGEWLAMVNDAFGMQVDETSETGELDAAKAWDVIGDEDIDLSAPVDDKFVTSTLMRAAGFADGNSSDEEIINAAVEKGIIKDANSVLSNPQAAIESLQSAQDAWANQEFEMHQDIQLADNVQNFTDQMKASDFSVNAGEVTMPSEYAKNIQKDSVFILPKEGAEETGGAYKAITVIDNGDGTSRVLSTPAEMTEVYKKVDFSGKYPVDLSKFEPANENVKINLNGASNVSQTSEEEGSIQSLACVEEPKMEQLGRVEVPGSIDFEADLGDDFAVTVSISNIALNTDVDWEVDWFKLDIDRIYMAVEYESEIGLEKTLFDTDGKLDFDKALAKAFVDQPSIEIGKTAVYICPGISVNLRVKLSLEASGKLAVTVTTENTKGFEITDAGFRSINTTSHSEDIKLTGEAGAYATLILALSLDYVIGEVDLLSLELKVGPTLKAEATVHNGEGTAEDMLCLDISGYLKIELKLYLMKDVMDLFGLEASLTLVDVDETNSPIKWRLHLENLKRTPGDVCTWGDDQPETTTQAATIPVGVFAISSAYVSINAGGSAKIDMKSLPSGYTTADLKWTSSDPSKVKVDGNGNVTAVAAGSVSVTVQTKDGKYKASCAVTVKDKTTISESHGFSGFTNEAIAA